MGISTYLEVLQRLFQPAAAAGLVLSRSQTFKELHSSRSPHLKQGKQSLQRPALLPNTRALLGQGPEFVLAPKDVSGNCKPNRSFVSALIIPVKHNQRSLYSNAC